MSSGVQRIPIRDDPHTAPRRALEESWHELSAWCDDVPPIDSAFIESQVGKDAREATTGAHHRVRYQQWAALRLAKLGAYGRQLQAKLAEQRAKVASLQEKLDAHDEFTIVNDGEAGDLPWRLADVPGVFGLTLLVLACPLIGITNLAAYLKESGMILYVEQPWAAYIASSLPFLVVFVLGELHNKLASDAAKRRYWVAVAALAVLVALSWLGLFSAQFAANDPGASLDALLKGLQGGPPDQNAWQGQALLWTQVLGEVLGATAAKIKLWEKIRQHRPRTTQVPNGHREQIEALKIKEERKLNALCEIEGLPEGRATQIQIGEDVFVQDALARLDLAQRQYLEQTSGYRTDWRKVP